MLERNIQVQLTILDNLYRSQVTCTLEELSKTAHCDKRSVLHQCDYLKVLSDDHITKVQKASYISKVVNHKSVILFIYFCGNTIKGSFGPFQPLIFMKPLQGLSMLFS